MWETFKYNQRIIIMAMYIRPGERDAIKAIVNEMKEYYQDIETEHLVEMVAFEASRHGIQPAISAPFARTLIEKM